MSKTTQVLLFVVFLVLTTLGSVIVYKQFQIAKRQDAIEQQITAQKELADNILRSMSQYATKQDVEKFAKELNVNISAIEADLDRLNAKLVAVNVATAKSEGKSATGVGSTGQTPVTPTPGSSLDPFGFFKTRQYLDLTEKFANIEVPIGQVGFTASNEKPWDYKLEPRTYQATTVIGTDENNKHYVYNKLSIKVADKSYDVKLDQAKTVEQYPEPKFSWLNVKPSAVLGAGAQFNPTPDFAANVGVGASFMSYGKSKVNPALTFVKPYVAYEAVKKNLMVGVNPVDVNVGEVLDTELIHNTYVGPTVGVATDKSVMAGVAVSVLF